MSYYSGGSGYGGTGGAGGYVSMGGWSGGITSITSSGSPLGSYIGTPAPMIDKEKMDAIYEALNGTSRTPREKKGSCSIPGCKTQCMKHNDYGGFICDDHYKTWKENNA